MSLMNPVTLTAAAKPNAWFGFLFLLLLFFFSGLPKKVENVREVMNCHSSYSLYHRDTAVIWSLNSSVHSTEKKQTNKKNISLCEIWHEVVTSFLHTVMDGVATLQQHFGLGLGIFFFFFFWCILFASTAHLTDWPIYKFLNVQAQSNNGA